MTITKRYRSSVAMTLVLALLATMMVASVADARPGQGTSDVLTVPWLGNGADSITPCTAEQLEEWPEGYFHWILTPGGNFTIEDAELAITVGEDSETFEGAPRSGERGAVHFDTPFFGEMLENGHANQMMLLDVDSLSAEATATYTGRGTPNPILTISDGCFRDDLVIEALLSGVKYLDRGFDGVFDPLVDDLIDGWGIDIYDYAEPTADPLPLLASLVTADGGAWSYDTGPLGATEIDLLICEEQREGWEQTGPLLPAFEDDPRITPIDMGDLGVCLRVQLTEADADAEIAGLDFGNVAELVVTKTAETSYEREHDWSITKVVDPEELYLWIPGQGEGKPSAGIAEWEIEVTYEGFEDLEHMVAGVVTVTNPTIFEATVVSITDILDAEVVPLVCLDEADAEVTFPATLPGGESIVCTYALELPDKVEATNTAVVVATDGFVGGTATAPLVWGEDPDAERYATVDVVDESALFGEVPLGQVTAPNGATFTDDAPFTHGEFDECGVYQYDNDADVVSLDGVVLDSADATLLVYVQCEVPGREETAWAADGATALQLPYNDLTGGNWATYTTYDGSAKSGTIFAGRTIDVGTYTMTPVGDSEVLIVMTLTDGWMLQPGSETVKIQGYDTAPSGNPAPGQFTTYKGTSLEVTVSSFPYFGIHLDVYEGMVPDPDFGP